MRSRREIYTAGLPAEAAYEPFVEFALAHAGQSVVDLGSGTGAYARRLQEAGKQVSALDSDPSYVAAARAAGVDAVEGDVLETGFSDGQFETAILFEVLEHVAEPLAALREALRIVRRNVLVTVPDSTHYDELERGGLTYWHLVTTDHVTFFAAGDMHDLARAAGATVEIVPSEPLDPQSLAAPGFGRWLLGVLRGRGIVRPLAHRRLLCVFRPAAGG